MTTPSINDFVLKTNKPLTAVDWETNLQVIINYLTAGTADLTVNSLTTTQGITAGSTITAGGVITGSSFVGDGSALSGLNVINRNWIINGDASVRTYDYDYTLVKDIYASATTPQHMGMATGTLVSAGTLTRATTANIGRTGYAFKFSGVTLTGVGKLNYRYRMQAKDAVNFINQVASFNCLVYHDAGVAVSYDITINKANAADDFSAVTQIVTSATSVPTATSTQIKYENVSMGNCANGIEIIVTANAGAVTLKNFESTEWQLEVATTSSNFEFRPYEQEVSLSLKGQKEIYYQVLTAATTKILLTNLLNQSPSDGEYNVSLNIVSSHTTGTCSYFARYNGDAAANYILQTLNWTISDTVAASHDSAATGILLGTATTVFKRVKTNLNITTSTGLQRVGIANVAVGSTATLSSASVNTAMWTNTSTVITDIEFDSSELNGFGIGSFVRVMTVR